MEALPPSLWMTTLVENSEDHDLFCVDQKIDRVGEALEQGAPYVLADGPELGGTFGNLLDDVPDLGDESLSESCLPVVIPGGPARDVVPSLLPKDQSARHRAAARRRSLDRMSASASSHVTTRSG